MQRLPANVTPGAAPPVRARGTRSHPGPAPGEARDGTDEFRETPSTPQSRRRRRRRFVPRSTVGRAPHRGRDVSPQRLRPRTRRAAFRGLQEHRALTAPPHGCVRRSARPLDRITHAVRVCGSGFTAAGSARRGAHPRWSFGARERGRGGGGVGATPRRGGERRAGGGRRARGNSGRGVLRAADGMGRRRVGTSRRGGEGRRRRASARRRGRRRPRLRCLRRRSDAVERRRRRRMGGRCVRGSIRGVEPGGGEGRDGSGRRGGERGDERRERFGRERRRERRRRGSVEDEDAHGCDAAPRFFHATVAEVSTVATHLGDGDRDDRLDDAGGCRTVRVARVRSARVFEPVARVRRVERGER